MTIHYGMIGCGMMGQEHLRNIALLDDTNVAVIYEPDEAMRTQSYQFAPNAYFVDSIQELLTHKSLDCLVISSPNHCHSEQLEEIAQSVTLPILCEKPLFTKADDLVQIEAFKREYKAPVWVAMEYRYMPPMSEFMAHLSDATGALKMLTITEHRFPFLPKVGNWNRFNKNSGGTFVEKCCHFFDLMRLILNDDPIKIMASAGQEVNHLDERYNGEPSDIWDCGYVIVEFKKGTRAMLELSMFAEGSEYQEIIHAVGSHGKIEVKIPGPKRLWSGKAPHPTPHVVISKRHPCDPLRIDVPVEERLLKAGDHNGATYFQHVKFLNVVRGQADVDVTLNDGIWAVRMGLAAQESALKGQAVMIE